MKPELKQKLIKEISRYLTYAAFLTLFFWAFSFYRRLILGEELFNLVGFGYDFVEALILAKVIMLGQLFGLGEKYHGGPLIYPTLYKTVIFSGFVLIFTVLEKFVTGFIKGKSFGEIYEKLVSGSINEILARIFLMLFVFVFFFAFLELEKVLGEGKLKQLFFGKRNS